MFYKIYIVIQTDVIIINEDIFYYSNQEAVKLKVLVWTTKELNLLPIQITKETSTTTLQLYTWNLWNVALTYLPMVACIHKDIIIASTVLYCTLSNGSIPVKFHCNRGYTTGCYRQLLSSVYWGCTRDSLLNIAESYYQP